MARNRALFVQDEWALARALNLALGLRHDQNQLYGDEWSPRLYGVWQPSPAWTLKGAYSHSFKAPNPKQIVPGSRAEGPNTFIGNPALQPERSDGVELGAGYDAGRTQAQLTWYDQRVEDLIEVRLLAPRPGAGAGRAEPGRRAAGRTLAAVHARRAAAHLAVDPAWELVGAAPLRWRNACRREFAILDAGRVAACPSEEVRHEQTLARPVPGRRAGRDRYPTPSRR